MTHEIVMPQLGITMTEGSVLRWLKAAGDSIEKGEPLFIVQTDKVDMEVESPGKGFVTDVLIQEEVVVPVGTVIAHVGDSMAKAAVAAAPVESVRVRRNGPLVSPRARRVASELGVDLAGIPGSGEFGRIRECDVRAMFNNRPQKSEDRSATSARKRIAEKMEESAGTVPQFSLRRELDAGPLSAVRDQLLAVVESREGVRLSFTDFLLKAMAVALKEVPGMNASWQKDHIEPRTGINLGFALQSPTRLLVPVITGADQLPISRLARRRSELSAKAKEGKLDPREMQDGSCTLSNLGAFGVDEFQAIVNPPESCILAAGRIGPRPFVIDGQLVVRPTLRLTLTVDHRVADGVLGAKFLDAIAKAIEQPLLLLA
ncbi:MAG: dihydrolipoamide acetyltransferase family protein [Bryobacteraceae bacterium]